MEFNLTGIRFRVIKGLQLIAGTLKNNQFGWKNVPVFFNHFD